MSCALGRGGRQSPMISVVIPTLNAEQGLAATLSGLVPALVDGLVRDVTVVDGGSTDGTLRIAEHAGVTVLQTRASRGEQLRAGARAAKSTWILFLHADTILETGWETEVISFIEKIESGRRADAAAAFKFILDDEGMAPRVLEFLVSLRSAIFRMPYGDQGLLISRALYNEIGGYNVMTLMEDVDIVRRLGRRRVVMLRSRAITSAVRYRAEGYVQRIARNQYCLLMYALKTPLARINTIYHSMRAD